MLLFAAAYSNVVGKSHYQYSLDDLVYESKQMYFSGDTISYEDESHYINMKHTRLDLSCI